MHRILHGFRGGPAPRATNNIVRGVVAEKINRDDNASIGQLSKNTARVNFLLMGAVMAGIWAGFDPLQQLLPPKYRGLELVFLCIAGAQLISGLNVSNNNHLGLSEHYRLMLPVNLALVVVTVAMNYLFLVVFEGLGWSGVGHVGHLRVEQRVARTHRLPKVWRTPVYVVHSRHVGNRNCIRYALPLGCWELGIAPAGRGHRPRRIGFGHVLRGLLCLGVFS